MFVDQKHLLLGADASRASLDESILQHERQRAKVLEQCLHKLLRLLLVRRFFYVVLAHVARSSALVVVSSVAASALIECLKGRATSTGQGAWRNTRSTFEPNNARIPKPAPCAPTLIRSISFCSA